MKKLLALLACLCLFQTMPASAKMLQTGETLPLGGTVYSDNGQYVLTLQASDGNLVLYSTTGAIWQSQTNGKGVTRAVMQPDGNFVLYTSANQPVFVLNMGRPNAYLNVQNDGNIVFYWDRPVWTSNTSDPNTMQTNQARVLYANTKIVAGSSYTVGQYFLILQADGNFVLYKNGSPIWYTNTQGRGVTSAWVQNDGNFSLYNDAGASLWNSGTNGNYGAYFAFQPDGNLVVYAPTPIWDRLAGFNHPDYKDHRGPGHGVCFGVCGGSIIGIPF